MPKAEEIAVLNINGQLYQDWLTVVVVHQYNISPYYQFRFTCSEGMPIAANFAKLQIKPGDKCTVTLAGHVAVEGLVSTRQVFYDGRRHYIEIQGTTNAEPVGNTSAISKGMEFRNHSWEEFAQKMLKPFMPKVNLVVEWGKIPNTKFDRISLAHGMTVLEALENPLRSLGYFPFTSNAKGDLVVKAGDSPSGVVFVEGVNILEGREIIFNQGIASGYFTVGQDKGTDKQSGPLTTHKPFLSLPTQSIGAISKFFAPQVMPMEVPTSKKEDLQGRASMDKAAQYADQITVFITVQGWTKPGGGLWERGKDYAVKSPMLLMKGSEKLTARRITFTQDNERGSRTVLELCNPQALSHNIPTT